MIQFEFSVLKANLVAGLRIVAIFWLALACNSMIHRERRASSLEAASSQCEPPAKRGTER
jgi:hypothetical protein